MLFATLLPGQVRQMEKIVVPVADTVKSSGDSRYRHGKSLRRQGSDGRGSRPESGPRQQCRHSRNKRSGDLAITVPVKTSLQLRSMSGGEIKVDGVHGEIDANNMNGKVTLTNVAGTVGGAFDERVDHSRFQSDRFHKADVVQHNEREYRCHSARDREGQPNS